MNLQILFQAFLHFSLKFFHEIKDGSSSSPIHLLLLLPRVHLLLIPLLPEIVAVLDVQLLGVV